jgi:hypothetical protein
MTYPPSAPAPASPSYLAHACPSCYEAITSRIQQVRTSLLRRFQPQVTGDHRLVQLTLNEAEALAWQTGVPDLVFPTLAEEKLRRLRLWSARQRAIRFAPLFGAVPGHAPIGSQVDGWNPAGLSPVLRHCAEPGNRAMRTRPTCRSAVRRAGMNHPDASTSFQTSLPRSLERDVDHRGHRFLDGRASR